MGCRTGTQRPGGAGQCLAWADHVRLGRGACGNGALRTAFITGTAAGFIGFHLAEALLREGWQVAGYDGMTDYYDVRLKEARNDILRQHPGYSFTRGMLDDAALSVAVAAARPDVIVHLAAQAGVTLQQAARRSWRIGQTQPVEVVFLGYSGTAQTACLSLMATKIAVSQSTSGDMPETGLDVLNQDR